MNEQFFSQVLARHTQDQQFSDMAPVGGGCINNTVKIQTSRGQYFIKWNSEMESDFFSKEKAGLEILKTSKTIKVPSVLGEGNIDERSYLLLEWVDSGHANQQFWDDFGIALAKLHQHSSTHFGLDHDNYIGRLPQANHQTTNWYDFFVSNRLQPQVTLAFNSKLMDPATLNAFDKLYLKLNELIPSENPSLLHGDLWSGNFMISSDSKPVLVDPAVHFGHRETEIAFTKLFGGFDKRFYSSYQDEFPLQAGFQDRIDLHNLYPLLVHLNLFGSAYLSGIKQTLKRFI